MGGELRDDISSDFVAARPDARTHSGNQIGRRAAEPLQERLDSDHHGAGGRAPPACMNRGDCVVAPIGEKNRNTIRGSHRQRDRRIACDGDVGFRPAVVRKRGRIPDPIVRLEHSGAMYLSQPDKQRVIDADGTGEIFPSPVFILADALERKIAGAETMRRDPGKRYAPQSGPPWLLHPLEVAARLG